MNGKSVMAVLLLLAFAAACLLSGPAMAEYPFDADTGEGGGELPGGSGDGDTIVGKDSTLESDSNDPDSWWYLYNTMSYLLTGSTATAS